MDNGPGLYDNPKFPLVVLLVSAMVCGCQSTGDTTAGQALSVISIVSLADNESQGNDDSFSGRPSVDGQSVVFTSSANNLSGDDNDSMTDIYLRDRTRNTTVRISRPISGDSATGDSTEPDISGDGTYIVFQSTADNIATRTPRISAGGLPRIFLYRADTGDIECVSRPFNGGTLLDGGCYSPKISRDGRYIAFMSTASNIVANDNNEHWDVFVYDRLTGNTEIVSKASDNSAANGSSDSPSISADGRYVVFGSFADNLVTMDTNDVRDIFVRDRMLSRTFRVSLGAGNIEADGPSGQGCISDDGRWVAFDSQADNLVPADENHNWDVFLYDCQLETTTRISVTPAGNEALGCSWKPSINTDGHWIVFETTAINLDDLAAPGVFVFDQISRSVRRASLSREGLPPGNLCTDCRISDDGEYVVFQSPAPNLVKTDNNFHSDVFIAPNPLHPSFRYH